MLRVFFFIAIGGLMWAQEGAAFFLVELQEEFHVSIVRLTDPNYQRNVYPIALSEDWLTLDLLEDNLTENWDNDVVEPALCFIPTAVLIFEDYTYVVSTYSMLAYKFANCAPFKPSAYMVSDAIPLPEEIVSKIEELQFQYFEPQHLKVIQSHAEELLGCGEEIDVVGPFEQDFKIKEDAFVFAFHDIPIPVIEEEDLLTTIEFNEVDKDLDQLADSLIEEELK